MIVLDDAQWCDEASLDWLLYLARRLERLPVLVLVGVRAGEPGTPQPLLDALAAEPVSARLSLHALGPVLGTLKFALAPGHGLPNSSTTSTDSGAGSDDDTRLVWVAAETTRSVTLPRLSSMRLGLVSMSEARTCWSAISAGGASTPWRWGSRPMG